MSFPARSLGFPLGPSRPGRAGSRRLIIERPTLAIAAGAALLGGVWTVAAYTASLPLAAAGVIVAVALPAIAFRPMLGLYAGILSIPLERLDLHGGGALITPAKALFVLTGVVAAGRLLIGRERVAIRPAHLAALGVLMTMAAGIAIAQNAGTTVKILAQWSAYLALSIYISQATREQLRRILLCLAVAGGIIGLIAALTAKSQVVIAGGQAATNRAEASFAHPAVLSFFLVLTFPVALAVALGPDVRRSLRAPLTAVAGVAIVGVVLTLTRSAILGTILALFVMMLWQPFRRLMLVLIVAILGYSLLNFSAIQHSPELRVISQRLSTVTQARVTADNQRLVIWAKTPSMIAAHPIVGVGSGNFPLVSPHFGILDVNGLPFEHAHDVFLTIAAELGLVGFTFFLVFLGAVVWPAARGVMRDRDGPEFPYMLALTAALAGTIVCGLTDYPPGTLVIAGTIMIDVGALFACLRLAGEGSRPLPRGNG